MKISLTSLSLVLACAVLGSPATASAAPPAPSPGLPVFPDSPFASAKVGDWWLVQSGGESGTTTVEWYIAKIDGDMLTVAHRTASSTSYAKPPPGTATASKTAPSLALYDLHPDAQATVVRGTCDSLGRSVPCATITYRDGSASYTIHTSPMVKGGLIGYTIAAGLGSNGGSLLGFGAGLDPALADPYHAPNFTIEAGASAAASPAPPAPAPAIGAPGAAPTHMVNAKIVKKESGKLTLAAGTDQGVHAGDHGWLYDDERRPIDGSDFWVDAASLTTTTTTIKVSAKVFAALKRTTVARIVHNLGSQVPPAK